MNLACEAWFSLGGFGKTTLMFCIIWQLTSQFCYTHSKMASFLNYMSHSNKVTVLIRSKRLVNHGKWASPPVQLRFRSGSEAWNGVC